MKMIIDITGVELTPGNGGINCKGNGQYKGTDGKTIECCCEECDYMLCCVNENNSDECKKCSDKKCPNAIK